MDSQRPTRRPDIQRVSDFQDLARFKQCLVQDKYYDYFVFFPIDENRVPNTANRFLFSGDEIAEDILGKFFSGP